MDSTITHEWRPCAGYLGFEINEIGEVRKDGTYRRSWLGSQGYPLLKLNGRAEAVHRLVCATFHGPAPSPSHQVAHLDGSKTNNHWKNLAWKTQWMNWLDSVRHGTIALGERHGLSRLTEEKVAMIRSKYATGKHTQAQLAEEFHTVVSNICHITTGKAWRRKTPAEHVLTRLGLTPSAIRAKLQAFQSSLTHGA